MGTPDFAVPCLEALFRRGDDVCAVFTQPDKPKGRGYQLAPPPVKVLALEHGVPVYQPQTLRDGEAERQLRALSPDIAVVVAYGKVLPKELLSIPRHGCINIHASLLPKYRGAGPIQWSVINGESETGVTSMRIGEGLDTGDMLLKLETPIGPDETAGQLHDRLCLIGARCLEETLSQLEAGRLTAVAQDEALATYAPVLTKELGLLDFTKPAVELHNLIRGLSPWPVAHTRHAGRLLKIYAARVAARQGLAPGELLWEEKRLYCGCAQGALELLEVQPEGARRMPAADFVNGRRVQSGELLGAQE